MTPEHVINRVCEIAGIDPSELPIPPRKGRTTVTEHEALCATARRACAVIFHRHMNMTWGETAAAIFGCKSRSESARRLVRREKSDNNARGIVASVVSGAEAPRMEWRTPVPNTGPDAWHLNMRDHGFGKTA